MRFDIISVIPHVFEPYFSSSVLGKARARGVYSLYAHDLRRWTDDAHHTVDDQIYGGGAGMLMMADPIAKAVTSLRATYPGPSKVIFFAPWGKPFTEKDAVRLSKEERIIMVCGRYEGIDERAYALADELFSTGDFVVSGGELPAMALADATIRRLPGALGDDASALNDSFSNGLLEYAQYTRPEIVLNQAVPSVLLSGNHAAIASWRRKSSLLRTLRYRPEMLLEVPLSPDDQEFLKKAAAHFNIAWPLVPKGAIAGAGVGVGTDVEAGTTQLTEEDKQAYALEKKKKRVSRLKKFRNACIFIAAAFGLSLLIRTFVVEPFEVPTGSMIETIEIGDRLFGEKISYLFRDPAYGDIATFIDPMDASKTLIKRVIATPGQTIDLKDGAVYIDGKKLDEPYVQGKRTDPQTQKLPYTLKEDEYWMMGDNRTNSQDSRTFGPIKRSSFTSHAWAVFWPFDRAKFF